MALAAAVPEVQARTDKEVQEQVATVLHMTAQHMQLVGLEVALLFRPHPAEVPTPTTTTAEMELRLLVKLQLQTLEVVVAVRDQTVLPGTRLAEVVPLAWSSFGTQVMQAQPLRTRER